MRAGFPDLTVTMQIVIADGPYVAAHLTGRGTHRGIFQGVPPTGRPWAASCTALYRVEDGQITEAWVNWDVMTILEQLGAVERTGVASA